MGPTNIIDDLTLIPMPGWWQDPWVIAALLMAVGLSGWWLIRWWTRRPRVVPQELIPAGPPPHEAALRKLAELRTRHGQITAYQLAIEVSDILREYIERRFRLPIRYQTTREFLELAAVQPDLVNERQKDLAEFLGFCDLVKFAQRPATPIEQSGLVDTAERFIRHAAGLTSLDGNLA